MNQMVLKALLAQVGIEPTIVENGVQAVDAWEQGSWDLILMDVQMPLMDGPAATREIRAREVLQRRGRTPIIALTANAMAHQLQAYTDAGMDGFVAKPIEVAKTVRHDGRGALRSGHRRGCRGVDEPSDPKRGCSVALSVCPEPLLWGGNDDPRLSQ